MAASSTAPSAEPADSYPRGLTPPTSLGRSRRLIGDVIVDLDFASRDTVEAAVQTARQNGTTTGHVLIESGAVQPDQLARALAERFGVDYIDLSQFDIDMGVANLIAVDMAKRYMAVPVALLPDRSVLLAMADPTNVLTLDEISMITA